MLKIEELTQSLSEIHSTEISLERPRKYPAGLPIRLSMRCKDCSRGCTIDLRLPDGFQSAYVASLEGVFSSLCVEVGKHQIPEEEHIGLPKVSFVANKE